MTNCWGAGIEFPVNPIKKIVRETRYWTDKLLACFSHLKIVLSSNSILWLPDSRLIFFLRTDASSKKLVTILLQYHIGYPQSISCSTGKLLELEGRYSTIERHCFAVILGILKFDFYLRSLRSPTSPWFTWRHSKGRTTGTFAVHLVFKPASSESFMGWNG